MRNPFRNKYQAGVDEAYTEVTSAIEDPVEQSRALAHVYMATSEEIREQMGLQHAQKYTATAMNKWRKHFQETVGGLERMAAEQQILNQPSAEVVEFRGIRP